ncbi:hypothetical protein [Telmatospirillum siberiense]|uniref:Transporter n=1 Tax=Telmatospirillum siberiense TaxID=382514 RepID=A0A2N3PRX3_9PROT|nr:hypothetical protein [Telmatospirillum siberiense]PKU23153.1 hypothetical protein CWS72_18175 [Telmatospirillum siberiense]
MKRFTLPVAVLSAAITWNFAAQAHGIAGDRAFPATLTIDDPAVGDELSLPTLSEIHNSAAKDGGAPGSRQFEAGAEWDKRITEHLGIALNVDHTTLGEDGGRTLNGWQNLTGTLKYQAFVSPEHEFMSSFGVIREFGHTGSPRVQDVTFGSTTPTLYFGKGWGDLPIAFLRPLAVTGTFGYQFSDKPNVSANQWVFGASVQYSLPYLQAQVKDFGLPGFLGRLTPLVEMAMTTPAKGAPGSSTVGTVSPGILYSGDSWQVGVEALLPATRATNTGVGAIAQFHLFLDDIFPQSLGRPLF